MVGLLPQLECSLCVSSSKVQTFTYNERTQFKTILCVTAGHNNLVPLPVLQRAVCGGPNASKRMTDTLCTYILIDQAELEASHYNTHLHLILSAYYEPVKTIQLTCWPSGEESVHTCPRHLDHTEPQSPDISLHPDDQTCSQRYEGRKENARHLKCSCEFCCY